MYWNSISQRLSPGKMDIPLGKTDNDILIGWLKVYVYLKIPWNSVNAFLCTYELHRFINIIVIISSQHLVILPVALSSCSNLTTPSMDADHCWHSQFTTLSFLIRAAWLCVDAYACSSVVRLLPHPVLLSFSNFPTPFWVYLKTWDRKQSQVVGREWEVELRSLWFAAEAVTYDW